MCYSITFFVTSMYFKVSLRSFDYACMQMFFTYFAVPAFWFFVLSFVFLSRMLIYQKAV
jgi:hypothetical protein